MKHLVIIGAVIPEPKSTAAGFRILQLMELFRSWEYKITFLTSANASDFSEKIEYQNIALNNDEFDKQIKILNPDIVLFDRYITEEQFGWRVYENCPNAIKILDTEDLHFLREARKIAFNQKIKFEDIFFHNPIFYREIASILRCDLSLIISKFEYQLLIEKFKINREILYYIPFLFEGKTCTGEKFTKRKHFVSIGNFLHEPNWQTVLKLKSIWKNIYKQLPESELHIYGAYASEKVLQLHNEKEKFLIKGRADSVKRIFSDYRLLLSPIPFGAGLKGKLFESMKYGIPNVTTNIGAEGMTSDKLWNGCIENDDENFIKKAIQLYQNEDIWKTAQENGFKILINNFSKEIFEPNLKVKIHEISMHLQDFRNRNFWSKLLHQNQLNSLKYMSKWIEEKNKNQQ